MDASFRKILTGAAVVLASAGSLAEAQVVKRDTKITGPKGNSVQRSIRTERTPGGLQRDIKITRPGGATFERELNVRRAGGGRPPARGPVGPGRPGGGGRNVYIEENHFYGPRPGPRFGGGPSFGLFLGGPVLAPPPVVVVPEPIYIAPAPPPVVVVEPPVRYAPPPEPEVVVVDPVADAMGRLESHHDNSRRDGALTLGRLGDDRAVPALMDRLSRDGEKEVRVAAAWALGEIGDPQAALAIQKASLYDRKREVRDAAAVAYRKLGRPRNDPTVQSSAPSEDTSLDPPPPPCPEPLPDAPR